MKAYKPFKYEFAVQASSKQAELAWHENEISLGADLTYFKDTAPPRIKKFITEILKLFTQLDVAVGENYATLMGHTDNNELRMMFFAFGGMEATHIRSYSLLSSTLGLDDFAAFLEIPAMRDKVEYVVSADNSFHGLIAGSAVHEGLSLFSAFIMLLNFQRSGLMLGACKITEFSVKDENLHVESMATLFRTECPDYDVLPMFLKAVEFEDTLIDYIFEEDEEILDLKKSDLKLFVRWLADQRLKLLNKPTHFNVENPLKWVDLLLGAQSFTNFFEQKVSDYSLNVLVGDWTYDA